MASTDLIDVGVMTWHQLLFYIYQTTRSMPGWGDIYEIHDYEDQSYFRSLDEMFLKR